MGRLGDVKDYWEQVEEREIRPFLAKLDPEVRDTVLRMLHSSDFEAQGWTSPDDIEPPAEQTPIPPLQPAAAATGEAASGGDQVPSGDAQEELTPAELALREVRLLYVAAKRRYRITPARLQQLQDALSLYEGTQNFHNYTIQKTFRDPSAKRHIKSFRANPEPIQMRDTQWLSLRVHGQSFMMHQIRKMVGMAVMLVRCGTTLERIEESYGERRVSIPKAPGLGLLLERPVFDSYNVRVETYAKEPIDFQKFEKEIAEFKDREIYSRMSRVEEEGRV